MPGCPTPEELHSLVNLPLNESRSRLGPYTDLILRWRRQGRGYTKIRELLAEKCSVSISRQVLTRFIKRHSKARKAEKDQLDLDVEPATVQRVAAKGLSAKERQARLDFVRSLNTKTDLKDERPKTGWDELEPETVSYQPKGAR